jgi:ferritin
MLSPKVEKILVEQIEKEGYSANLYLSMAAWAETEGYSGISTWFYAQAEDISGCNGLYQSRSKKNRP